MVLDLHSKCVVKNLMNKLKKFSQDLKCTAKLINFSILKLVTSVNDKTFDKNLANKQSS